MSYPHERIYRPCIWCARPVRTWKYLFKQHTRGKFCSTRCYLASRRAFSDALADGRLEAILAPERKRAKAERLSTFFDSAGYSEVEARYTRHLPP
jgi:hypothetical protein